MVPQQKIMLKHVFFVCFFFAGGLHGIFESYASNKHCIHRTSARATLFERMLDVCGMISDLDCLTTGKHRDLDAAQVRKTERAI